MRRTAPTAALALALALAACTSSSSDAPAPQAPAPQMSEIALPDELRMREPAVDAAAVLGAAGRLPATLVVLRTAPGADGRVETTRLGRIPDPPRPVATAPVNVTSLAAASDGRLSVIVGSAAPAGTPTPFVLRSTDRATWVRATVPQALTGATLGSTTVAGKVLRAGYVMPDGAPGVLSLGDTLTRTAALPLGDASEGDVVSVAARGRTVVALGTTTEHEKAPTQVVWRSTDDGATFSAPVALRGARAEAAGVVATTGSWIVTGVVDRDDSRHPAAWTSRDGATFSDARTSWAAIDGVWRDGRNAVVGAPSVGADGRVYAWLTSGDRAGALVHSADGGQTWRAFPHHVSRPDAMDINPAATFAVAKDRTAHVLRRAGAWAELMTVGTRTWTTAARIGAAQAPLRVTRTDARTDGPAFALARRHFMPDDDGWTSTYLGHTVTLGRTGTSLDPSHKRVGFTITATDAAAGRTAALGLTTTYGDGPGVYAFVGDEGTKLDVAGSGFADSVGFSFLAHVEGTGFLAGLNGERDDSRTYELLRSADGSRWTRTPPKKGSEWDTSAACALPSGGAVAVGSIASVGSEHYRAASWTTTKKGWATHRLTTMPEDSHMSSCTSRADDVVVTVRTGGASALWRTTDGATFKKVADVPSTVTLTGALTTAGSLLVSGGTVITREHAGPVVWFSPDGARWRWVPVPTPGAGSVSVAADGADLVAVVSGSAGPRAFRITEVGSAWDAGRPPAPPAEVARAEVARAEVARAEQS